MELSATDHNESRPFLPTLLGTDWKMEDNLVKLEDNNEHKLKERDPSEKELCECIIMIKDRFPYCKLDRVIQLLHDTLLKEENE
jgi:hypothetical protein